MKQICLNNLISSYLQDPNWISERMPVIKKLNSRPHQVILHHLSEAWNCQADTSIEAIKRRIESDTNISNEIKKNSLSLLDTLIAAPADPDKFYEYFEAEEKYEALQSLKESGLDVSYYIPEESATEEEKVEAEKHFQGDSVKNIFRRFHDAVDIAEKNYSGKHSPSQIFRASSLPGADEESAFLIEDFMEENTFNSIIGQSKAGKTMFAMQMAFCVQNGLEFLGHKCQKSDVLIVDFEMKPQKIKQRYKALREFLGFKPNEGLDPYYMSVCDAFSNGDVDYRKILSDVQEALHKNPSIKLVIFDCYYTFALGDPNAEIDTRETLRPLKALVSGCSVCYVHHTNKRGTKDVDGIINSAGGSGVHGKIVDTTYVISKASDDRIKVYYGGRNSGFSHICCIHNDETSGFFQIINESEPFEKMPDGFMPRIDPETFIRSYLPICKSVGVEGTTYYKWEKATRSDKQLESFSTLKPKQLKKIGFSVDCRAERISLPESVLSYLEENKLSLTDIKLSEEKE